MNWPTWVFDSGRVRPTAAPSKLFNHRIKFRVMDKETLDDFQHAFASLQTFMLRLDAMHQASDDEAERERFDAACNKLSTAVTLTREAMEIVEQK